MGVQTFKHSQTWQTTPIEKAKKAGEVDQSMENKRDLFMGPSVQGDPSEALGLSSGLEAHEREMNSPYTYEEGWQRFKHDSSLTEENQDDKLKDSSLTDFGNESDKDAE